MTTDFPLLIDYLNGYWHQDFDIYGDSIEEITDVYLAETPADQAGALVEELDALLSCGDDQLVHARSFGSSFAAVRPEGWNMTTRQWMAALREHLVKEVATEQGPTSAGAEPVAHGADQVNSAR